MSSRPAPRSIRALIVDDEPLARRGIRQLLAAYPAVTVVGECRDGAEALRDLAALQPDLVFLDVQMPGLDGMDLIKLHGAERMPITVFVTAHDAYAVRAFDAQALDYLVKPLGEARFRTTMQRVLKRVRSRSGARIAVPTETGEMLLDESEIDWIEALDDYCVIHAAGREYRVRQPLSALAARDPAGFIRLHRSIVVRLDRVRELRGHGAAAVVQLRDGTELPVSRRRLAAVRARLAAERRLPRTRDRSPRAI